MKILRALLPSLLSAATLVSHAQATPSFPPSALKLMAGVPVVNDVYLNGQGPFCFVLDTGSQTNLIDTRLARKLELPLGDPLVLINPAGQTTLRAAKVKQLAVGGVQARDQEFLLTDFDGRSILPPDARGILGQEFLAHFDYLMDLQHRRFALSDPPRTGRRIGFSLIFGRMALQTNLGSLVLDSGASVLSLFRLSSGPSTAQLISASGQHVAVSVQAAPSLILGDSVYHLDRAQYLVVSDAQEAGLLPVNAFHAVYVSNSEHYVLINPQP